MRVLSSLISEEGNQIVKLSRTTVVKPRLYDSFEARVRIGSFLGEVFSLPFRVC